jgi:hypothetical protein
LAAVALLWDGAVRDVDALLDVEHVGMFASMLAAMLLRLEEYTSHAGHPDPA